MLLGPQRGRRIHPRSSECGQQTGRSGGEDHHHRRSQIGRRIERFDLEPEFVTLTEACQLMRVGKTTLHKLINQDLIDTEKAGKKTLVRLRSIRGYGDGAA